jgi:coenzyme PQQ biosynthesis protein PqqD
MPEPEERPSLGPNAKPRLPRGVRLQESAQHGGHVLLAPERVFKADAIAVAVLQRCTGDATLGDIANDLARTYNAPRERVLADVTALLSGLAEKRMLEW